MYDPNAHARMYTLKKRGKQLNMYGNWVLACVGMQAQITKMQKWLIEIVHGDKTWIFSGFR